MLNRVLTLSAIVSLAAAQVSLSSSCTSALTRIAANPDANACLLPTRLLPIITNPNASIVDPVNNWLTGLCSAPSCSNATLSAIVTNATAGCSAELATIGISTSDNGPIIALVQQYYPAVRKAACLKDGNTNCVTQTLTNVQDITGPLTVDNLVTVFLSQTADTSLPANVTCTNCLKEIYNIVDDEIPGVVNAEDVGAVCGAAFVDGTTPAGITQSASDSNQTNTSTKDNGAATISSLGAFSGASLLAFLALLV